jgi:hypothetical protein
MKNSETLLRNTQDVACDLCSNIMDSSRANDQTGSRSLTRDSTTAKAVN